MEQMPVGAADAGGFDAHEQFIRSRFRRRDISGEKFANGFEADGFHIVCSHLQGGHGDRPNKIMEKRRSFSYPDQSKAELLLRRTFKLDIFHSAFGELASLGRRTYFA